MLNDNEAEARTLRAVIGEKRLLVDPRQIQNSVRHGEIYIYDGIFNQPNFS